jgi:hypothetical protein
MRLRLIQLFIIGLTISASLAYGQEVQKILPRPNDFAQYDFTGIACSDERNCTIAALRNDSLTGIFQHVFERTTDGGLTWHQQAAPYPINPHSLFRYWRGVIAIDSLHVVAYGDSGLIARTTNAGATWIDASVPEYRDIFAGSFYDRDNGLLVGGGGLVLLTTDGGATWRYINGIPMVYLSSAVMFSPAEFSVFKYGLGPIYSSSDAGQTFDSSGYVLDPAINSPDTIRTINKVVWQDPDTLLALGSAWVKRPLQQPSYSFFPLAMRSVDRGNSWHTVFFGDAYTEYFGAVSIHPSGVGLAGGADRGLLSSTDWGKSWRSDSLTAPEIQLTILSDVKVLNPGVALANYTRHPTGDIGFLYRINLATLAVNAERDKVRLGTHVSPNPSTGIVNIRKWYSYDGDIRIVDVMGRTVLRTTISHEPGDSAIDCSALSNGTYSVLIQYEGANLAIGKFVLMK